MKLPAPKLSGSYDEHVFPNLLLCQDSGGADGSGNLFLVDSQGFTLPVFFGIIEITVALSEMKEWDLNSEDSKSTTTIT